MEFTPVLLPDEAEAGAVWRSDKLQSLDWKLRQLGLSEDPLFASLLAQVAEHTAALEELHQRQQAPEYQRPWWADGEYDSARADRANDEGLAAFKQGQHSEAFARFTEAIRLCPRSAVYHSNRSAAALKVGRADIAAEDADNALAQDPALLRACLRGGKARLALTQPEQAQSLFEAALGLDPACAAAQRGVADAAALMDARDRSRAADAAAAARGSRAQLPREAAPEEAAAEQLLSAEAVLVANPGLHAALCARVEGLILCRRYPDAQAACAALVPCPDRDYLSAEAQWRAGELDEARDALQAAVSAAPGWGPPASLLRHVDALLELQQRAEAAEEEGRLGEAALACTRLAQAAPPGAALGLHCAALRQRAGLHAARRMWGDALADLDAALAADGCHAASLLLRAEVRSAMGDQTGCFLDLVLLQKVAPTTPGLFALMEAAAKRGIASSGGGEQGASSSGSGGGGSAREGTPQHVLGVGAGASRAQARAAYLQLAARWHPDKWGGGSEEEREAAGERFRAVQAAYEALCGS